MQLTMNVCATFQDNTHKYCHLPRSGVPKLYFSKSSKLLSLSYPVPNPPCRATEGYSLLRPATRGCWSSRSPSPLPSWDWRSAENRKSRKMNWDTNFHMLRLEQGLQLFYIPWLLQILHMFQRERELVVYRKVREVFLFSFQLFCFM